jgi:hypothetical protein
VLPALGLEATELPNAWSFTPDNVRFTHQYAAPEVRTFVSGKRSCMRHQVTCGLSIAYSGNVVRPRRSALHAPVRRPGDMAGR